MLLIVTNSLDGTADALGQVATEAGLSIFRLNTDLLNGYSFRVAPGTFAVSDRTGRTVERSGVTACLWRKPWLGGEDQTSAFPAEERRWVDAQFRTVIRELVNICRNDGLLRLVENDVGRRADKLLQMELAARYFDVPEWEYVYQRAPVPGSRITKPLSAEIIESDSQKSFVYSTAVRAETLSPDYPWLVQNLAKGTRDITSVFIAGSVYHFGVVRRRNEGAIDWRENINTANADSWERVHFSIDVDDRIRKLMADMGLRYGRLDFILDEATDKLSFLEVNSNGQFGWLDDETLWLHRAFFAAVMNPANTIRTLPCMHASLSA